MAGPSLRGQGLDALQSGDLDRAVELLSRAILADDRDIEAKALVGVAYSQKGLHAEAQRALQTAVEREPGNPNHRLNLGVVRERAGDLPGAAVAYAEALQLQPDHPGALARLDALGPQAQEWIAGAPKPLEPVGVPLAATPPPPAAVGTATIVEMPPGSMPSGLGSSTVVDPAPGAVKCPACGQATMIGMVCEWCSGPLAPPPPVTTPIWKIFGPPPDLRGKVSFEEDFNLGMAFKDWMHVTFSPRSFWADQGFFDSMSGPCAFILVFTVLTTVVGALSLFATARDLMGMGMAYGRLVIGWLFTIPIALAAMFGWAGVVQLCCMLFRGRSGYIGSFRVVSYAAAPMFTAGLIASTVVPSYIHPDRVTARPPHVLLAQANVPPGNMPGVNGPPAGSNAPPIVTDQPPVELPAEAADADGQEKAPPRIDILAALATRMLPVAVVFGLGYLWSAVLLGMGVTYIHQMDPARALGVTVLSVGVLTAVLALTGWTALGFVTPAALRAVGVAV